MYADTRGLTLCKDCLRGRYRSGVSCTRFENCPEADSYLDCQLCPHGKYQDEQRSMSCKNCGAGKYQPLSLSICATGYFPWKYYKETGITCSSAPIAVFGPTWSAPVLTLESAMVACAQKCSQSVDCHYYTFFLIKRAYCIVIANLKQFFLLYAQLFVNNFVMHAMIAPQVVFRIPLFRQRSVADVMLGSI